MSICCTHEIMKSSNFLNQSSFSKLSYFHLITLNTQNPQFILKCTCHSYQVDHFAEAVYLTHCDTSLVSCLWWACCVWDTCHQRQHQPHLLLDEHPQPICDEVTDMYMCLINSHWESHSHDHWNEKYYYSLVGIAKGKYLTDFHKPPFLRGSSQIEFGIEVWQMKMQLKSCKL